MDITYLLWLQDFRNAINDSLTPFMEWISLFGVREILLLPAFVYWCLNKRTGLFILLSWKISQTLNAIVKLSACVYRPWVRDARIIPAGDAIKTAGGYSFPSGHTMMVTPIYGGLAIYAKKIKWLCALFILAILVTMFSRNYLGVHTPQDVVVGLFLGIFSLYVADFLLKYIDKHPEKDTLVMILCAAAGILTLVYVTNKSYPMDYVDGKLLVDPEKMTIDAWGDAGAFASLALAWYIESRFIKFEPTGWNFKGVVICVIGLVPLYWLIYNLGGITAGFFGPHWGKLVSKTILIFYIMIFWPIVLKLTTGKKNS
ncbi:MAG: phosphatase PAP2 family protein [Synergistaceae bacterium]|nr:phosphatase PAP2 family protein [Synergistaceae bacterium]